MKDEFRPPIKERETNELLEILGVPDRWNPKAVLLATNELTNRKINPKRIKRAKYLSQKQDEVETQIKVDESYNFNDFFPNPFRTLMEMTFSWELKKDGFLKKAQQQNRFRIVLGIIIFIFITSMYLD